MLGSTCHGLSSTVSAHGSSGIVGLCVQPVTSTSGGDISIMSPGAKMTQNGSFLGPKWVKKGVKNDPFLGSKYPINQGKNREMGVKKGVKNH